MGMCFTHPLFLLCSLFHSLTFYFMTKKGGRVKKLLWLSLFFLLISFVNPVFNNRGNTVLFTWPWGSLYTLEALYYGFCTGAMFVSVILWFITYNEIITSDKLLYCFGALSPSVSMILTMVLRLLPDFQRKIKQITQARKGIGRWIKKGTGKEQAVQGMSLVSVLTTWALEGGIITADSMKSRGFGSTKRTCFGLYSVSTLDYCLIIVMLLLMGGIVVCAFLGGTEAVYFPRLIIQGKDNLAMIQGVCCYFLFLSIPAGLQIWEEATWYILKSKI